MEMNLTLLHGFLGDPTDWDPVVQNLSKAWSVEAFAILKNFEGRQKDPLLNALEKTLANQKGYKLVVGYSLGGRLALELKPESYDQVLLIGAHPGLQSGQSDRLDQDLRWVKQSEDLNMSNWLELWNQQEVFANDQIRPKRNFSERDFRKWMDVLETFSLGKQADFSEDPSIEVEKILWCCGDKDTKFQNLKGKIISWLGEDRVSTVPQSGHGVIFDRPDAISNKINEVLSHVR